MFFSATSALAIRLHCLAAPVPPSPQVSDTEIFEQIHGVSIDEVRKQKEPFKEILQKAESGDIESEFRVGVDYQLGLGVAADEAKAAKWYYEAARKNHSRAAGNLAGLLSSGTTGVAKNIDEAIRYYRIAASAEDRLAKMAAYNLGCLLLDRDRDNSSQRKPTAAEQAEGVKWFKLSAELGFPPAMQRLSNAYRFGIGIPKNMDEAYRWCSQAAELGAPEAQWAMGLDLLYSKDAGKREEAIDWFHKAAVKGLPAAECKYGEFLLEEANAPLQAIPWIQKAANAGWAEAEGLLGEWFVFREGNNPEEGIEWLKKAAAKNYAKAQNNLGNCFHMGKGVPLNTTSALRSYEQAGDNGEPLGWTNAACIELFEQHNEEHGMQLLRKAADAHEPHAQFLLAKSILSRHHQDAEHEKAKMLLIAANEGGAHEAQALLDQIANAKPMIEAESMVTEAMVLLNSGIKPNAVKAVSLLTSAARSGYAPAQAKLAECYKSGIGVSNADIVQACKWYLLASRAHFKPAEPALNALTLVASNKEYEAAVREADLFRPDTK